MRKLANYYVYSSEVTGNNTQWRWWPRRIICAFNPSSCDAWNWLGFEFHPIRSGL